MWSGAGVVCAHARGDHDPRAHGGGRPADRGARPAPGQRRPARGRHHQPELPRELRRGRTTSCACRASAPRSCGHRPQAECIANKAAAGLGIGAGGGRDVRGAALPRDMFVDGREMTAEELREPEVLKEVGRDLRRVPRVRDRAADRASTRSGSSRSTRRARASAAPSCPTGYDEALRARTRSRRRSATSRRTRPCPRTTTCSRRTSSRRRPDPADRLGVRRHGRPLVRPRQLRGQQRAGRRPGGRAAGGLLRRAARRAPPGDAEAVPLHVGLPRGDVGRRAARRSRSSTSTSASTPTKHFDRLEEARRGPALRGLDRGGRA